jgi:hexosaminidase
MKDLIPLPAFILPAEGSFELNRASRILVSPDSEEMLRLGQFLAGHLHRATGFTLPVSFNEGLPSEGVLQLTTQGADPKLGLEGYALTVTPQGVQIVAPQPAGIFYGIQTLRQLLPPELEGSSVQDGPWLIEAVTIRDWPRFSWRGTMLDVARHFFGIAEVKGYIDLLAAYKLNVLHLHLTDDQGWRIEIRSWPNLTAFGGETAVNGDPGGFYTQAQYAEIVAYAQQRYITIVPEIDLPGHTNAALASYPELNCDGKAPERYTGMEVGFSSLCIEKDITYHFIDDVLHEVAALTPGPYVHIGGDEAHSTPDAVYKTFIERIEPMVTACGKQIVGWEEIAQCNISTSAVVQYWKDIEYAKMAAEKGNRLILSPAPKTYLDMKYHADTPLGQVWAGTIDVEKAYRWDPATEVKELDERAILGVEAPLWTETMRTMKDVEFMAFPRLLGIAEIAWSPASKQGWEAYCQRLAAHGRRLRCMAVNFYPDPKIPWT